MARFLECLNANTTRKTIRLKDCPQPAKRIRLLREGFWEETAIHERAKGDLIVRKASKSTEQTGPWALETLRREIRYLQELPAPAKELFPPLLHTWDDGKESLGYEIPFYQDHHSVAERIAKAPPGESDARSFQEALANALFDRLHTPTPPTEALSLHVITTIGEAIATLRSCDDFRALVDSDRIVLNESSIPGLQALWDRVEINNVPQTLDEEPSVLLHGDLILENILCPRQSDDWWEDLILIDPVSVAGISVGPALFDLVKYESYASGELIAIRTEMCQAGRLDSDHYHFSWNHSSPLLSPYANDRWTASLRDQVGQINEPLYHLLEAYFSLVMAVNTTGTQQWARVLKGASALHASLDIIT